MRKYMKTVAMIMLAAALGAAMPASASALPEGPGPIRNAGSASFVEVPSNSYFYQNIISRDGDVMSQKPVIIDFNATWCGPCQRLKPILKRIASKYDGQIKVFSVDIDKVSAQNDFFEFESIPYVVFLTPEGEYDEMVGLASEKEIEQKILEVFGL